MSSIILGAWCLASPGVGGYFQPRPLGTAELAFSSTLLPCLVYLQGAHVASIHLEGAQRGRVNRLLCPPEKWVSLQERKSLVLPAWRVSLTRAAVLGTQGYRGTHESLGDPQVTFPELAKQINYFFSQNHSYGSRPFRQWCYRLSYHRQFFSRVHHKVNVLVSNF